MSLESQIADLVTEAKGLIATFNGKKAEINAAVSAAIAAIPSNAKTYYINTVIGDDKAAGTAAAPLKSLKQALYNTPAGGQVVCYLQTDHLLDTNVAIDNRVLHICSDTQGLSASYGVPTIRPMMERPLGWVASSRTTVGRFCSLISRWICLRRPG